MAFIQLNEYMGAPGEFSLIAVNPEHVSSLRPYNGTYVTNDTRLKMVDETLISVKENIQSVYKILNLGLKGLANA